MTNISTHDSRSALVQWTKWTEWTEWTEWTRSRAKSLVELKLDF
jgi:hypothetical protein